jgi:hypothetical protein
MVIFIILNILFTSRILYSKIFDLNPAIKWTLAITTSFALYSIIYFGILVFNMNFYFSIIGIFCINIVILFLIFRKIELRTIFKFKVERLNVLFIFIVLYSLIFFIRFSVQWGKWDAWAIWNLHAKFLFYSDFWENLFTNKIAWTHPDYPLMLPSIIALFWKSIGSCSFVVPLLVGVLPYIGILTLLFFSIKNKYISIISVLLIVIDFNFIMQSSSQYADILLAFFYLLSTILISNIDITNSKNRNIFYFIGFISASCFWIKNEGVVFFIFTALIFVYRFYKERQILFKFGSGAVLVLFVIGTFKFFYAPSNDLITGQSIGIIDKLLDLSRYVMILTFLIKCIALKFPVIPIILIYILFSKQKFKLSSSFIIIILTFIAYLSVYIVTPRDLQWHLETSLERLIIQLYPAFLFAFFDQTSRLQYT